MKKVSAALISIAILGLLSIAQAADEQKAAPHNMPMMNSQTMKGDMGAMNCPMMKDGMKDGMMGGGMMMHHRMMHDSMKMMKDMMVIQKKMLGNPSADEKMAMDKELAVMIEKVDKMMANCQNMMNMQHNPGEQKKEVTAPVEHKH
ncbi:MAG TPA: hypothetical protein VK452_06565 [Dissulfurispiraceae bacterium]|nr:hypothetical protein [Dissulfurispiraceae bacterium]